MADSLPGAIVVPTRDVTRDRYIRDALLRAPGARKDKDSQLWVDANTHADTATPLYAIAIKNGQNISLDGISGTDLQQVAIDQGLPGLLGPVGASGFLVAQASSTGGTIFAGDVAKDPTTGLRVSCTTTKLYKAGANVPVLGVDTGPQTNLPAGTVLQWQTQRPGIGQAATVFLQSNGLGLSGGRDTESDDDIRARIREARANPPASGNDAEYQITVEGTPGLAVQKCFTYPAIMWPSSMGYVFLLRPATLGGSRIPNATQIAQALAYVAAQMPASDSIFDAVVVEVPTDIVLQVSWAPTANGWSDAPPWPLYSTSPVVVTNDTVPTATSFTLDCSGAPLVGGSQAAPLVGNRIAFYDAVNLVTVTDPVTGLPVQSPIFRLKTLKTVTGIGGGKYTVTCDTSNANTDTLNVPIVGQPCCPWSDSLSSLIRPVLDHFTGLGPGEQASAGQLFDAGLRRRRSPRSPQFWANEITHRVLTELFALSAVEDVSVLAPALPYVTPVGTLGVSSNLLAPRYLTAFAQ